MTWQTTASLRTSVDLQPQPQGPVPSPRRARTCSSKIAPRRCRTSRRRTTPSATTRSSAARIVVDARFGRMWGTTPSRYQAEVQPTDISIRDVSRFTIQPPPSSSRSTPTTATRATLPAATSSAAAGRHATTSRPACSSRARACIRAHPQRRLLPRDRVTAPPFQAQLSNTPIDLRPPAQDLGRVPAGPLDLPPLDVNAGVRLDGVSAWLPEQTSPPGPSSAPGVPRDRRLRLRAQRRAAPRLHLRPVRQRPDRRQGLLRPLLQPVRLGDRRNRQPQRHRQPVGVVERRQLQPAARPG